MARSYTHVLAEIEKELKTKGLPALSWYDILLELDKVDADGLRPFELQEKLLLPQYGISRLVARIEKAGYLERVTCAEDGRGQSLRITKSGRELRQEMWQVYGPCLQNALGQKISDDQAQTMVEILRKI